jgi:PAS domain S-box-containing protein
MTMDTKSIRQLPGFFELLTDSSILGIWVLCLEGKTLYANKRMGEMLGITPEEMEGQSFLNFMSPEMRSYAIANLDRRNAGISETHDFVLQCRRGHQNLHKSDLRR